MAERQLGLDLATPPRRARAAALKAAHYRSHVDVEAAVLGEVKAERQNDLVLGWMRTHRGRHTPWDVAEATGIFVTSCRRALTDLTVQGLLRHWPADRRDAGPLRSKSSTWEAV